MVQFPDDLSLPQDKRKSLTWIEYAQKATTKSVLRSELARPVRPLG